ncbi:XRE family transcriptional regulator, partial [Bacteroides fragilis]
TGKWLSEQLSKDPSTVSKWCSNKIQPSLEVLDSNATNLLFQYICSKYQYEVL